MIANYKGPIVGDIQPTKGTTVKLEANLLRVSARLPRELSFRMAVISPTGQVMGSDKHAATLRGRALRDLNGGDVSFRLVEWLKKTAKLRFDFVEDIAGYAFVGYGSLRFIPWECSFPLAWATYGSCNAAIEDAFTFSGEAARRYAHFKAKAELLAPA